MQVFYFDWSVPTSSCQSVPGVLVDTVCFGRIQAQHDHFHAVTNNENHYTVVYFANSDSTIVKCRVFLSTPGSPGMYTYYSKVYGNSTILVY
jgi:hypothetical protein